MTRGSGSGRPGFLTPREVAEALRVSDMTVYRLIKSGELRALRIGKSFRISEEDFDAYLADRKDALGGEGVEITYEASGEDWFVLSGKGEDRVVYLRVEAAESCGGDPIFAHLRIGYPTDLPDRAALEERIGGIAATLSGC